MEVTVAKSAGFCFGVKRAVDTVLPDYEEGAPLHAWRGKVRVLGFPALRYSDNGLPDR